MTNVLIAFLTLPRQSLEEYLKAAFTLSLTDNPLIQYYTVQT